ncbi:acyl carrier protein [Uliginosibacterium sp. H3]|uniref:Acyl carrier protein n=1 Tax=Uliginosibacterium silvisoli TaxID=3114758 RepID=A0ABU6K2U1_9RHOO|nr:acyl carrier protein [Uliginosibacterium sp. H3]
MQTNLSVFVAELLALVLDASEKPVPNGGITATEVLFGNASRLQLDSLDALQISMAIQKAYGIRLADSKDTRRAMMSLESLAKYLLERGATPKTAS